MALTKQQVWDVAERVIFTAIEGASATGIVALAKWAGINIGPDEVVIPGLTALLAWLKSLIGVKTGNGTAAILPQDQENIPTPGLPATEVVLPEVTPVPEGSGPAEDPVPARAEGA